MLTIERQPAYNVTMRHVVQYDKASGLKIKIHRSARIAAITAGTSYVTFSRHMRAGGGELRGFVWLFQHQPAPEAQPSEVNKNDHFRDHRYGKREGGYVVPGVVYCQSCGKQRTPKMMIQICVDCAETAKKIKQFITELNRNPHLEVGR